MQGPHKLLYFGTSNRTLPTLRLDVNHIKSKTVFLDDAVDPAITRFSKPLACISTRSAVAHRNQQLDNDLLEEFRADLQQLRQYFRGKLTSELLISTLQRLIWSRRIGAWIRLQ